jgi:hypothetical protein
LALAIVRVDAFDADEFGAGKTGHQQMTGNGGFADVAGEVIDSEVFNLNLLKASSSAW